MSFKQFSQIVSKTYNCLVVTGNNKNVFRAGISGDALWAVYLSSFPEGTNPIFRERTEHDCSSCRNFVKNLGNVVHVTDSGQVLTVWDGKVDDEVYSVVSAAMKEAVLASGVIGPFVAGECRYGGKPNRDGVLDVEWNHFYGEVPRAFLIDIVGGNHYGKVLENRDMLNVMVETFTEEAFDDVISMIKENSLYRGSEFLSSVEGAYRLVRKIKSLSGEKAELQKWREANENGVICRFKNSVIGTLVSDISDGVSLTDAVRMFESKVAPHNYKRPTAVVTKSMVANAKKKIEELGIEDSLYRRHAVRSDISVNNVLFVDRSVQKQYKDGDSIGDILDSIGQTKAKKSSKKDAGVDISVEDFLKNVLPNSTGVSLFVKNELFPNFMSLVAPVNPEAAPLFKWGNSFSWTYDGGLADSSIRERVKKAGGKVDGAVRVSLSWHNGDDLDLSVENSTSRVYFGNRHGFGAELDVDMNAGWADNEVDPVENIFWRRVADVKNGTYKVFVNNFNRRSPGTSSNFEVELEFMGEIFSFSYPQNLNHKQTVHVGSFTVSNGKLVDVQGFVHGGSSSEKWGVKSNEWVDVELITKSPNYWDENGETGNAHLFFILKDCKNPDPVRGFYNEFLRSDLVEHRKVFEVVAEKMKAQYNDDQLSGIGISSTKKDSVTVKVIGAKSGVYNIKF